MQVQKSSKTSAPKPDEPQRNRIEAAEQDASEAASSDVAREGTSTQLILPDLHPMYWPESPASPLQCSSMRCLP